MCKIIDGFIFYNELDLLTYRVNLLNEVVDYFIIVESTHTFTGKEKQLFYNENKILFEKFHEKIIHVIVDDFPYKYPNINMWNNDVWKNEYFQRNAISRGINRINDISDSDVIIITDLDEIPDPNTLDKIKKGDIKITINTLTMDFYYYNLNAKYDSDWTYPKILLYEKYKEIIAGNRDCHNIRYDYTHLEKCPIILKGGWHLSYFGDKYFIQNKIFNFSHQELNLPEYTELSKIEERIQNSQYIFGNNTLDKIKIEDNNYLPMFYDIYLTKYYSK